MKIYICGPISGLDIEIAREQFEEAERMITSAGHEAVNPMKNGLPVEVDWKVHMKRDIALLIECDAIATMRGWEGSRRARLEVEIAKGLGMGWIMNLPMALSPTFVSER